MTKSDGLFVWCWAGSIAGYIATAMALMDLKGAVGAALSAAAAIYLGHVLIKQINDYKLSANLVRLASSNGFRKIVFLASIVLAACSIFAIAYYFVRWDDRELQPSLNALLVSPLAYYGFACGKLILRRPKNFSSRRK